MMHITPRRQIEIIGNEETVVKIQTCDYNVSLLHTSAQLCQTVFELRDKKQ